MAMELARQGNLIKGFDNNVYLLLLCVSRYLRQVQGH
jgi:hypothetical protein